MRVSDTTGPTRESACWGHDRQPLGGFTPRAHDRYGVRESRGALLLRQIGARRGAPNKSPPMFHSPIPHHPSIGMRWGCPKTPIHPPQKAARTRWGFSGRTGIKGEYLEYASISRWAIMSPRSKRETCNSPLNAETVEVPAMGSRGAVSKARQTTQRSNASSA